MYWNQRLHWFTFETRNPSTVASTMDFVFTKIFMHLWAGRGEKSWHTKSTGRKKIYESEWAFCWMCSTWILNTFLAVVPFFRLYAHCTNTLATVTIAFVQFFNLFFFTLRKIWNSNAKLIIGNLRYVYFFFALFYWIGQFTRIQNSLEHVCERSAVMD